jgi:hypothetical protein
MDGEGVLNAKSNINSLLILGFISNLGTPIITSNRFWSNSMYTNLVSAFLSRDKYVSHFDGIELIPSLAKM